METRLKRGDTHPDKPGVFFLRYHGENERWTTQEGLNKVRVQKKESDAKWKAKPEAKEYKRVYARNYYHTKPGQKEYQAEYSKQPKVKAKMKAYYESHKVLSTRVVKLRKSDPDFKAKRNAINRERRRIDSEFAAREKARCAKSRKRDSYRENRRQWERNKMLTDIQYKLRSYCRNRILKALRNYGIKKSASTEKLLGCTISQLRDYLQCRFQVGMEWSNMGRWHVDHIVPLSGWRLDDPVQLAKALHYTNLQPLWAADNLRKSDRLDGHLFRARELA